MSSIQLGSIRLLAVLSACAATAAGLTQAARGECVEPPLGLVGWWAGDGSVGNRTLGATVVLQNGATFGPGYINSGNGQAFSYDGVNDISSVASSTLLNASSVTVEVWVNPDGPPGSGTGERTIAAKLNSYGLFHNSARNPRWFVFTRNPACVGGNCTTGSDGLVYQRNLVTSTAVTIPLNSWTHLAGTYDEATGESRLYMNGSVIASATFLPGRLSPTNNPVSIGGINIQNLMKGLVDDVAIYNRALDASEIQAIYAAGSDGKCWCDQFVLNGDFETGSLAPWTVSGENGGFATVVREGTCFSGLNTLGITVNDTFAANVRSSGPAPLNSVGILTSAPFTAGLRLEFGALSESHAGTGPSMNPVNFEVRILDAMSNPLISQVVPTNIVVTSGSCAAMTGTPVDGTFSSHSIDLSAYTGQIVRAQFRQNTNHAGLGYFTLIDDVTLIPEDYDGISYEDELALGTDPCDPDSDNDGLGDGDEVGTYATDPLVADSDGDGLSDGEEVLIHGTDPLSADTDADGLSDSAEINTYSTNPNLADTDDDGLSDGAEINTHATNPLDDDSDDDGLSDGAEVASHGSNPLVADTDGDGLSDGAEVNTYSTNPNLADTDGDFLSDAEEITLQQFGCPSPLSPDSDGDGLLDGIEHSIGLNLCDDDSDGDGLADALEVNLYGTNPLVQDTDGDGLFDGTEVDMAQGGGCPSPTAADSDGDTLGDGAETTLGTSPCSTDTDADMVPDNIDDEPTNPGVSSGFIEDGLRDLCDSIGSLPLDRFAAPNGNARQGRRNAMCNKVNAAANAVAAGDLEEASDQLQSLLEKVDGEAQPPDWMVSSAAETGFVYDSLDLMIFLISLEP